MDPAERHTPWVDQAKPVPIYVVHAGEHIPNDETIEPHNHLVSSSSETREAQPVLHFWSLEILSLFLAAGFMSAMWSVTPVPR